MKSIERISAEDCIKHKDAISTLLQEIYSINLPGSNLSAEQGQQMTQELVQYLKEDKAILFGAFKDEDFVGFLWAYPRYIGRQKRLHLNQIIVKSESRGLGFGKMLMNELEVAAIKEGCEGIELLSSVSNKAATNLYESLGFEVERIQFYKGTN
ncbi:MAG: GNAT family N-acetyltransferase [Clostridiales bacterium]|jgi:ribosomal protein S18 acetylase RimI-like enzyme|nr:GNAT family N-acetyltransferase [Clostridiales bacterium]